MRTIENKKFKLSDENSTTYFEIIAQMVSKPPVGGWVKDSMTQVRMRLTLKSKFELGKDSLKLEEDQYKELLAAYDVWGWGVTVEDVILFDEYIRSVPQEEIN